MYKIVTKKELNPTVTLMEIEAPYVAAKAEPGQFVDENGTVLGTHKGIAHYTIGQRKGLGISFGEPMFVTKINAEQNQIVLGKAGSQYANS